MFMSILKKKNMQKCCLFQTCLIASAGERLNTTVHYTSANFYKHLDQQSGARLYTNNFLMTL